VCFPFILISFFCIFPLYDIKINKMYIKLRYTKDAMEGLEEPDLSLEIFFTPVLPIWNPKSSLPLHWLFFTYSAEFVPCVSLIGVSKHSFIDYEPCGVIEISKNALLISMADGLPSDYALANFKSYRTIFLGPEIRWLNFLVYISFSAIIFTGNWYILDDLRLF
jgi:hypothetical protein